VISEFQKSIGVKAGVLAHPCPGVIGNTPGPSLYHLLEVIGKEKVMGRIEKALQQFRS